jgi:hypothetical protein
MRDNKYVQHLSRPLSLLHAFLFGQRINRRPFIRIASVCGTWGKTNVQAVLRRAASPINVKASPLQSS